MIFISTSLSNNLHLTSLSEPVILNKIQSDSTKSTKLTRFTNIYGFTETYQIEQKKFKNATYQRPDDIFI